MTNEQKAAKAEAALRTERDYLRRSPKAETASGSPRDTVHVIAAISQYIDGASVDSKARLYDLLKS